MRHVLQPCTAGAPGSCELDVLSPSSLRPRAPSVRRHFRSTRDRDLLFSAFGDCMRRSVWCVGVSACKAVAYLDNGAGAGEALRFCFPVLLYSLPPRGWWPAVAELVGLLGSGSWALSVTDNATFGA